MGKLEGWTFKQLVFKDFLIHMFVHQNNPPLKSRSFSLASQGSGSPSMQRRPSQNAASFFSVGHHKLPAGKRIPILQPDHLIDVREVCIDLCFSSFLRKNGLPLEDE